MQRIAIDHVVGKRSDLLLGYYIVKNRGPDEADKTLEQGQLDELRFFSKAPWSALKNTGKAGIGALKARVRELLVDLIKKEFPKLKQDVVGELSMLRSQLEKMGPSRSDQHTQRSYLNDVSEAFQSLARDALNAYYTGDTMFEKRHDLRLITRVVEANEKFSNNMSKYGHMRRFAPDSKSDTKEEDPNGSASQTFDSYLDPEFDWDSYPELDEILDPSYTIMPDVSGKPDIMDYIEEVYKGSRGQELGTVSEDIPNIEVVSTNSPCTVRRRPRINHVQRAVK